MGAPDWIQCSDYPACPACGVLTDYVGLIGGADLYRWARGRPSSLARPAASPPFRACRARRLPFDVVRAARKDGIRRRDELLDAALRCFDERGLLATGIEDIRKAAGASPSSVYNLFGGLPDLTAALLVRTFERVCTQLVADVTATSTARDAVRALVQSHLNWVGGHRVEARFMYQAMALELAADHAAELAAAKLRLQAPILAHIATFAAAGDLPPWTPQQLETVLLGPTHEMSRRFLAAGEGDLDWARAVLPELAWQAIRAAASTSS